MAAFYYLTAAALAAFAYFFTTFFSRAQVASLCCPFLYALCMIPAFVAVFGQVRPAWLPGSHCILPGACCCFVAKAGIRSDIP